ncbi:MAG: carbohydrate binding domain-containing protein, partial [Clostridia bacterium]|nr:carbohydrate binding domain-containing protein [Clostridia bacterium]
MGILRKIFAVMTAVLMLSVPVMPVSADEQYNVELIVNPGFESVNASQTAANSWGGFSTWRNGSVLSLVKKSDNADNVHSGDYAVKFETKAGDNPFFSQQVSGLYARCKYRISFWYKIENLGSGSGGVNVKIEQNGGDYYSASFKTKGGWRYATHEFYMYENTRWANIMPRTYTEGDIIYLDDISLVCLEGPEQFDMQTDWVFYYDEFDKGTVTVNVDPFYDASGYTADFKITNGVRKYGVVNGLTFTDNKLVHTFDLTELKKKTEYTMTVTVRDGQGDPIQTLTQYIYRIDRPTNIREDGVYMVDGKPFEPMIAYHFDLNDAENAVRAGVNVFQWGTPSLDAEKCLADLDEIQQKGMMAAVVCYWGMKPAGHPDNQENIKKLVEIVKDHPAVFCYMVMDEPFSHASGFGGVDAMEDLLRNSYKIIRMIDDKHPVYLCEDNPSRYPTSIKYVDTLGIDPYPGDGDFGNVVAERTSLAVEAAQGVKPVYSVVQSMSWKGVIPDGPMLRTQLYQAMMSGAQCVGYYPWVPDNAELDKILSQSRYWDTMLSFNDYDKPILYGYYARGEYEEFASYKDNNMWYDIFTDGDIYYLAVSSKKSTPTRVSVSLQNNKGDIVPRDYVMSVVNGGNIEDAVRDKNWVDIDLDRYGAVLYRFEKPTTGDEKVLTLADKDHNPVYDIAEVGANLYIKVKGFESGERIFVAEYDQEQRLLNISNIIVKNTDENGEAFFKFNPLNQNSVIKAFVWDGLNPSLV